MQETKIDLLANEVVNNLELLLPGASPLPANVHFVSDAGSWRLYCKASFWDTL